MSPFPIQRPRRLREKEWIRSLVRENEISVDHLVFPLFVTHGKKIKNPVKAMPGVHQFSVDQLEKEAKEILRLKIPAVILFGIPETKDAVASSGVGADSVIVKAIRTLKQAAPELGVIADVCLCAYTDHGDCGVVVREGKKPPRIDNDATLEILSKMAGIYARAGADMVAPSDMMDGRVLKIRDELDAAGYKEVPILSYAVKYASSFYGPFREAAGARPPFGDRRSYQMDPANVREALREAALDLEEGADILLVKPALPCLDVLKTLRDKFSSPLAAFQVSGESSMIKAAAANGYLDE